MNDSPQLNLKFGGQIEKEIAKRRAAAAANASANPNVQPSSSWEEMKKGKKKAAPSREANRMKVDETIDEIGDNETSQAAPAAGNVSAQL